MNSDSGNELIAVLTGIAGLLAALIGLLRYFNYRSKKDRMAAVGTAFEAVVESLADSNEVRRTAAAIRLRRFFDPTSELATRVVRRRLRQRFRGDNKSHSEDDAETAGVREPSSRRLFAGGKKTDADGEAELSGGPQHRSGGHSGDDEAEDRSPWVRLRRRMSRLHADDSSAETKNTTPADAAAQQSRKDDKRRRLANKELPYAADALNVIVAILRSQPPGNFQKLLADALIQAPEELLHGADLQRTNLQDAWLGRIDLSRADFYRADLSNASFKGATASGAQFYEARLVRTVFTKARLAMANFFGADLPLADFTKAKLVSASFAEARAWRAVFRDARLNDAKFANADLREADFEGADLAGATFDGARLDRAKFAKAENVPDAIVKRLGNDGVHREGVDRRREDPKIFVSQPSVLTPEQRALIDRLETQIDKVGGIAVRLPPEEYPPSGSLGEIRKRMSACSGVAIVGMTQVAITAGIVNPGTPDESPVRDIELASPWNELEAGMAFALCLPMLALYEDVDARGVFGVRNENSLTRLNIREPYDLAAFDETVARWLSTLTSYRRH